MSNGNQPKAPDFSAVKGELEQVLVCVKDEGNVQNYRYKNLEDVRLKKGGATVGEFLEEVRRYHEETDKCIAELKAHVEAFKTAQAEFIEILKGGTPQ